MEIALQLRLHVSQVRSVTNAHDSISTRHPGFCRRCTRLRWLIYVREWSSTRRRQAKVLRRRLPNRRATVLIGEASKAIRSARTTQAGIVGSA